MANDRKKEAEFENGGIIASLIGSFIIAVFTVDMNHNTAIKAVRLDHELRRQELKEFGIRPEAPAPSWWPAENKTGPRTKRTEMPSNWNEWKQPTEKKKARTGPFPVWE